MSEKVDITDIANWFLSKESMTHKKLQKLCYYAIAWGWALMDKPVSSNSKFEAWIHGPVSPVLYAKYRDSGWNNLPQPQKTKKISGELIELLESVWITYGGKGGNELEALSHKESPWIKARKDLSDFDASSESISPDDMKTYYRSIYIEK
ncbi:DUF4065 domain-containing protein [Streptomyces caniscabiei]|uniref:Panacea domain-containing protein n=1 Tax=Streptomyces caniscabiei TaxID=2746961 RepID=UPI0029B3B84F|nr:type II toxin-antitoxin system antitoxin SocA domain-containing protein [Streptomyces caniscabiei]MDX2776654.1 DUF4065 domain-containing protein [Streptomyces caniscabiei]